MYCNSCLPFELNISAFCNQSFVKITMLQFDIFLVFALEGGKSGKSCTTRNEKGEKNLQFPNCHQN